MVKHCESQHRLTLSEATIAAHRLPIALFFAARAPDPPEPRVELPVREYILRCRDRCGSSRWGNAAAAPSQRTALKDGRRAPLPTSLAMAAHCCSEEVQGVRRYRCRSANHGTRARPKGAKRRAVGSGLCTLLLRSNLFVVGCSRCVSCLLTGGLLSFFCSFGTESYQEIPDGHFDIG